jgi:hypothetical protein
MTAWLVNDEGDLYALLNGMPYGVDFSGTPLDGVKLPAGTYPDDDALNAALAEASKSTKVAAGTTSDAQWAGPLVQPKIKS